MLSTPREKNLAMIFGSCMVLLLLWETVGQIILQPLNDAQTSVSAGLAANDQLRQQSATVEHALRNLKQSSGESLPADPGKASVLYQGWLIRHLESNGIESAVVTPAPPIVVNGVGHRIPIMIQCSGSMAAIAGFLDQFHATPLLHRMTNLSITALNDNAAEHRVTISVEALSLTSGNNTESLPEPGPTDETSGLMAVTKSDDFFRRQFATVVEVETVSNEPESSESSEEPVMSSSTAKVDPEKSIRFVASVWNGSQREAWFIDQRSKTEQSVVADSELSFPDIQAKVLSITEDSLLLDMAGTQTRITLGQTLVGTVGK